MIFNTFVAFICMAVTFGVCFSLWFMRQVYEYVTEHSKLMWIRSDLTVIERLWYSYVSAFASYWHGYEMHNSEVIARNNCLLIGYHSRPSVDLIHVIANLQCYALMHYGCFAIPLLGRFLTSMGAIPSRASLKDTSESQFVKTLCTGTRPLLLTPGGGYEFLKLVSEINQIHWKETPGFARIVMDHSDSLGKHTTIVPFYTKNCEKTAFITKWWYNYTSKLGRNIMIRVRKGHLSVLPAAVLVLYSAIGFPFLLKPVKLDTYFGDPIRLKDGETAAAFGLRIQRALQELINHVHKLPERPYPHGRPGILGLITVGTFVLLQNMIIHIFALFTCVFIAFPVLIYQFCVKGKTFAVKE